MSIVYILAINCWVYVVFALGSVGMRDLSSLNIPAISIKSSQLCYPGITVAFKVRKQGYLTEVA